MSAVKNLRAMFEQKGDSASPPDRGRSPGIPHGKAGALPRSDVPSLCANRRVCRAMCIGCRFRPKLTLRAVGPGTDSPRPLSKVRTSFIAIEKDGRIGLQREGSQDSISALRKPSGDSAVTTPTTATERSNPFDFITKSPVQTGLKTKPIFESPKAEITRIETTPPAPETKPTNLEAPAPTKKDVKATGLNGTTAKQAPSPKAETPRQEPENVNGIGSGKDEQKPAEKEASKTSNRGAKPTPKPLSNLSGSKPASKPLPSPTAHKALKSPVTLTHHPAPKKTPEKKAQPPEKPSTPRNAASSKPAGPSSTKKPPPIQSSPPATGFVKPKPKSPTRPVKLPAGLTTHTASSGGKVNAPRQSLSRASGSTHPAEPQGRSPSRTSVSTGGSAHPKPAVTKGLKRQSSTISRPRPSLGPPPKQPAKDHPPTKREKEIDQGFLARMMRPTQASASKTTEKVLHTTPPRKPAAAAAAAKKAPVTKHVKKAAQKLSEAASSSVKSENATTDKVAAAAEQAATAERNVQIAKAVEREITLSAEAGQKSSAQKVAPAAEQSETVEEIVAAAEEASEVVSAPQPSEATTLVEEPASSPVQPAKEQELEQPAVLAEEPVAHSDEPASQEDKAEVTVPETKEIAVVEEAGKAETPAAEEKGDVPETTAA